MVGNLNGQHTVHRTAKTYMNDVSSLQTKMRSLKGFFKINKIITHQIGNSFEWGKCDNKHLEFLQQPVRIPSNKRGRNAVGFRTSLQIDK